MKRAKTGCEIQLSEFGSKHLNFFFAGVNLGAGGKLLKLLFANKNGSESMPIREKGTRFEKKKKLMVEMK